MPKESCIHTARKRPALPDAVPIDQVLSQLGYSTPAARHRARRALEHAGLTNAGKSSIHPRKRPAIRALLRSRFFLACGSQECAADASRLTRDLIRVAPADCETCAGSPNARASSTLRSTFEALGLTRLLVVGGGPGTHEELRAMAGHQIRVDVIDGSRRADSRRARALADNADVIAIWGSTILPHAVSKFVTTAAYAPKSVTIARRGLPALVAGVAEHCRRRGIQHAAR